MSIELTDEKQESKLDDSTDSHEILEQMKDEVEISVITDSTEKAQKSLQADVKIEILEDKEALFELAEIIKDIFPEIEDQDMEDCLDEIEKYRKIL